MERSAGAVIFTTHQPYKRKGLRREYLLLRYDAGHWDFPKGHLEGTESAEKAARREIREETGLVAGKFLPGFQHHMRYWFWNKSGKRKQKILKTVTYFLTEAPSRRVRLSWEHSGYAWLPYRDAVKLATYKNAKELIERAEEFLRARGYLAKN